MTEVKGRRQRNPADDIANRGFLIPSTKNPLEELFTFPLRGVVDLTFLEDTDHFATVTHHRRRQQKISRYKIDFNEKTLQPQKELTCEGPPERIIPLRFSPNLSISLTGASKGSISEYTPRSLTLLDIKCVYCPPKSRTRIISRPIPLNMKNE